MQKRVNARKEVVPGKCDLSGGFVPHTTTLLGTERDRDKERQGQRETGTERDRDRERQGQRETGTRR